MTPKAETISFAYDVVNQLLSKTLPGSQVTSYTYDAVGNLAGVTDPDSALTMTYDLANRLLTTSTAGSSNQPSVALTYTYDKNGNRLTVVDPTATNSYVYDVLNRLTSLTSPAGATSYAFDTLSRRTSVTLPNGTQTTYTYDPASQVTAISHQLTAISQQLNKAEYTYNTVGNRTSLTDRRGAQAFGYDNLDRLTSATHPLTADQTFSYDPVGNRTTNSSLYNVGNQLTEDTNFTYSYDANGNLTRKTFKTSGNHTDYTYDAENRLIRVDEFAAGSPTPGATSTYRYDGLGRRIEKIGNGITRRYVYDAEDILLEYDGANVLQARYTHGPGIDEPIAMTRGGATYFYHTDGLRTVTELTDATGVILKSYAYDAYGNILDQTGTVENPYTYTGREFDAESGLYYYRERYYDPRIGRFLQKDPVGFSGGINFYSYVLSNPTNLIDPWGLWTTAGHRELTTTALGTRCFSSTDIAIANKANRHVDRVSNQLNNPDHYMPGTGLEAEGRLQKWLDIAVARQLSGDHSGAMQALGTGLHPVQDKWAHDSQAAGWSQHNPLSDSYTDPDNPEKHKLQFFEALRESKAYADEFLRRTGGAPGSNCACGQGR